jgi:hypothetical protein
MGWSMKVNWPHPYAVALLLFLAGALAVTVIAGVPSGLPDVALGSGAVLHVERALVIMAAIFFIFVLVARAWEGELPNEISRDGFKYPPVAPETVEDAKVAAAEGGSDERGADPDDGDAVPDDLLGLRLKLEAKLSYIAKVLLRPEDCKCATFVTIGSLKHDGFLTDREARTATQVLTLRDEELDTLPPRMRREFLRSASTVVGNIRASVFYGLVRVALKENGWEIEEIPATKRRPDLLVQKGEQAYRVVPRFVTKKRSERIDKVKRRLRNHKDEAPGSKRGIVVLPDSSRTATDSSEDPVVVKFADLKSMLGLEKDPRALPG